MGTNVNVTGAPMGRATTFKGTKVAAIGPIGRKSVRESVQFDTKKIHAARSSPLAAIRRNSLSTILAAFRASPAQMHGSP